MELTAGPYATPEPVNLIAPPAFANAAAGDFHQVTGSNTINAGVVDSLGTLDIDGETRTQGAPDIGADEFVDGDGDGFADYRDGCPSQAGEFEGCPVIVDACNRQPPETAIADGPSGKTKSKSATVSFSGTILSTGFCGPLLSFECKLDSGPFAPCGSPTTYNGLKKGLHKIEVRAVDSEGSDLVDPTPATHSWTVKKKKKKKKK